MEDHMINQITFIEACDIARIGTKGSPAQLMHTWFGWISNQVLHIRSKSGARCRDIWHFDVASNVGKFLIFKNTTSQAYCYTREGPQNALEAEVSPLRRFQIEYVDAIDVEMKSRGDWCKHYESRETRWYNIVADGNATLVRAAAQVGGDHQYHHRCLTGPDHIRVVGGTFAVEYEKVTGAARIFATNRVDLEWAAEVFRADRTLRILLSACPQLDDCYGILMQELVSLAQRVIDGKPFPQEMLPKILKCVEYHLEPSPVTPKTWVVTAEFIAALRTAAERK